MKAMEMSNAGLDLTKSFEGLRLDAYQDGGGVWTIGYGHTGTDVCGGKCITEIEAETLLLADLHGAMSCVNTCVDVDISQNQFDALVDFCFNVGEGNFRRSSLLRCVKARDFDAVPAQLMQWVNVDGKRSDGLVRRRTAEATMFVSKLRSWRLTR